MISRSTQSTVTLYVRSVSHRHHHLMMMMMKKRVWTRTFVCPQTNIEDQKRKIWNIWFQEVFGVEVINYSLTYYLVLMLCCTIIDVFIDQEIPN